MLCFRKPIHGNIPIVEILSNNGHKFFNYDAKPTNGSTSKVFPADLPLNISDMVVQSAKIAHRTLRCRTWSRKDMIIQENEVHILETNTIPGITENSFLPHAARAAGLSISQLLDKLINLSLEQQAFS